MDRLLITATVAVLSINGVALSARALASDDGPKKAGKHDRPVVEEPARAEIHMVFSPHDAHVIREYYAPRYHRLPPGQRKKLARTGSLPPGWQKKMEPIPVWIERDLVTLPSGYRRGVMDGHAVIYNTRTEVIIDSMVIF
jgi:hypothetical protein